MTSPDFLVIGAYKCGTTALHHYLRAHPGLFVPARKEPNYFAFAGAEPPFDHPAAPGSIRDLATYEGLFMPAPTGAIVGEVSPAYLAVPGACERIRTAAPDVRLVAVLRDPVERAYSDYLMYRRDGMERAASFRDALDQQAMRDRATDPTSRYIDTGRYAAQLAPYLVAFPRDRIHVLLHEDLRDHRDQALRGLFEFLGVDPTIEIRDQAPSNVSGEPGSVGMRVAYGVRRRVRRLRPLVPEGIRRRLDARLERQLVRTPLPDDAAELLIDTYREDVARLADLIQRDLSGWLQPTMR